MPTPVLGGAWAALQPLWTRLLKSPSCCGISWTAAASQVTTPNRRSTTNALPTATLTDQVVQSVGGKNQISERAVPDRAMAVVPVRELLEHME
ncbi:hypothetical protein CBI38_09575 [Rhodococcus oxybenzonivorans]|uniref:Uncharacterized protein n=1 Tax=Rhodococcus oxybenzonivorans TaxID=1990687 RepID=A0A2S2BT56_9NOCA|nr:hypothetical protein [Rhodococcus oxybenzonivorans]AWK71806.1 hypothetical protein CBI38_09575 [Rhodococcus oxybenzonivorans]